MKTLMEAFEGDTRTKTIRLIRITGERIARLPIDEALEKYGECLYSCAYSESYDEVSVWIIV